MRLVLMIVLITLVSQGAHALSWPETNPKIILEETDRGLFVDSFKLTLDGQPIEYGGITCNFMNGATIENVSWDVSEERLVVKHALSTGSTITGKITYDRKNDVLLIAFDGLVDVSGIETGSMTDAPKRLFSDIGWVMGAPFVTHTRSRLATNFVVVERESGVFELIAGDMSEGYRYDADTNQCAIYSVKRTPQMTFRYVLSKKGVVDAVKRYRNTVDVAPPRTIGQLENRFCYDDWSGNPTECTIRELEYMKYVGATDLYVLFHVWQKYGYDIAYPDVFPPNDRVGGIEGIKGLADYCKQNDIPFGIHDNYSDLYPDSEEFKEEDARMIPGSDPENPEYFRGWFNEHTGVKAYVWAGEPALKKARSNFEQYKKVWPLTTTFLDVSTYANPYGYDNPAGVFHDPVEVLEDVRRLYDIPRNMFDMPMAGECCYEKYIGVVDAGMCDLWSIDRWNVDPKPSDWEYYPLFNTAFHPDVLFQGAGYATRYKLPDHDFSFDYYSEQTRDDYRASRILNGNSGVWYVSSLNQSLNRDQIIDEYYLSVPLAHHIEREPIANVEWEDDNIHRIHVTYENGAEVWVNRDDRFWKVNGVTLPVYGVMVRHGDFTQMTMAQMAGRLDIVRDQDLFYINTRGNVNSFEHVATDGAVVFERNDNGVTVRPLNHISWLMTDFSMLAPDLDFAGATVRQVDYDGNTMRTFTLDEKGLFEEQMAHVPFEEQPDYVHPMPPRSYYPHYVVECK